jgi:flagellar export protein FliJ
MTSRRKRVQKVLALRQEQLELRVRALNSAQAALAAATQTLHDERARLELAVAHRGALSERAAEIASWRDADAWIATRAQACELARRTVLKAEAAVERARQLVVAANRNVQRIQALAQRLDVQARAAADRSERLLEDELASRRFEPPRRPPFAGSAT